MLAQRFFRIGTAICLVLTGLAGMDAARADGYPKAVTIQAGERVAGRLLKVGLGRSVVVNLGEEVSDVIVSNPEVADAVVRSSRRVFIMGNKAGQASLFLFGRAGNQIASFDLAVENDTTDLNMMIRRALPGADITAESVNGNIVLSGTASSTVEAQQAADLAARFSKVEGSTLPVLNMVSVSGKDQVHLKVTVAEVERSIIKQLGVNLSGTIGIGNYSANFNSSPGYSVNSNIIGRPSAGGGFLAGGSRLNADLQALQRDGVIRTLAEPTLTAISGENASFLAGGEFPIPIAEDNNKLTVQFKKFGVGLDFTPVVLSGGRISLRIKTEVSEITQEGAVSIGTLVIPALKVRRAESTVELPSGGTLVMAGLLKESYKQDLNGVPGLMQVPILGALFKSRDFLRQETELAVFVTPYTVRPTARSELVEPTRNLAPATDGETIFLNRLNRMYRVSGDPGQGAYHGQVGYIYE